MRSIFADLWNGNIEPCEDCCRNDPELKRLSAIFVRKEDILQNALNDEQKELLKEYTDSYEAYTYLFTVHAFRYGFSLAGKLLTEVLSDHNWH